MKEVTTTLEDLETTPPAEIRDQWERLFRQPVPPHSPHLLRRQIAWRLQAKVEGDLSPSIIRQLTRSASAASEPLTPRAADALSIGSRLIREWNGCQIEVVVVDKGYEYDGRHFRSLSQIARHITGAHWSGPRFLALAPNSSPAMADRRIHRCAIYTRKSTEDGLDQDFNSLDAQREACAAYILSQASEGWESVPDHYDDGGFSGGSMKRPALERLLEDVVAGKVDIIVVYKVDRLTRSLADFAKIVEILDAHDASFVSVTQSFNTTNSMGRLTLNVLLSFAQFEREVTGERIRDKVAASKKKGIWMGGNVPMGYLVQNRKLVIDQTQAVTVRHIFKRYCTLKSVPALQCELTRDGIRSPERISRTGRKMGGKQLTKGAIYHILQNRIYLGDIMHEGKTYPGEHQGIVDPSLFDEVQQQLEQNRVARKHGTNADAPSLLKGLVCDGHGRKLTPSHTSRKGRRYRYYVTYRKDEEDRKYPTWRVPAIDLEEIVIGQIVGLLTDQQKLREHIPDVDLHALQQCFDAASTFAKMLDRHSASLTHRLLCGLVKRVTVHKDRIETIVHLNTVFTDLPENQATSTSCTLSVPASIVSNGRQSRIVVPSGSRTIQSRKDASLIKLIAKAWDARTRLETSDDDIKMLAKEAGHEADYFARLVRLGYLAPDIITAVLEGRQPATLTRQKLARISRLPNNWNEQRIALGFAPLN